MRVIFKPIQKRNMLAIVLDDLYQLTSVIYIRQCRFLKIM
jgi:hypothetical protein